MTPDARRTPPSNARSLAWDDFRLINAIAEARTLPAAGKLLGLDHSTVFRRLRQIEKTLRTAVFERHRGGYVLTAAGSEIAALAARVDQDITAVLRRIDGRSPSPAGEVRIATSDALLFELLMPLLVDFKRECPDVRLDLVTGNSELNLSRRDADVAIRATKSPPETLVGRKVATIAWAGYASAAAFPTKLVEGDDLFKFDTSWVGFGDALADLAAAKYISDNVLEHRIACRFDTVSGMLAGIEGGIGIGFLPCFAGDRHPALIRLVPPIPPLAMDLWILTHADLRHVPRVRVLMEFLGNRLTTLQSLVEGRE